MTEEEKKYSEKIRREFEDEQKIARAVELAIYIMLTGVGLCWFYFEYF